MAGPYVRDTNAPDLFDATVTLDAAATETGAAIEVNSPGDVVIELLTGTVTSTGDSATLEVEVQASNVSTFATYVAVGAFADISGTDTALSDQVYRLKTQLRHRYARVVAVTGGTTPDFGDSSCKVHPVHNRESIATDTAGVADTTA